MGDMDAFFKALQNFGALAILALMVWRLPGIIGSINQMTQDNVKNVRDTQKEALDVFKGENDKILTLVSANFKVMEDGITAAVNSNTAVLSEIKTLSERVRNLENERNK